MRTIFPDKDPAARVRTWVDTELHDFDDFYPEKIGTRFPILDMIERNTAMGYLMDGHVPVRPAWAGDVHPPSAVLNCMVARTYTRNPAHWVELHCHDDAYWTSEDIFEACAPPRYVARIIDRVYSRPADEGGATCLALLYDARTGMILFKSAIDQENGFPYHRHFTVDFYGNSNEFARLMLDFAAVASLEPRPVPIDRRES